MDIGGLLDGFYRPGYTRLLVVPALLFPVALFVALVAPGLTPGIDLTGGNRVVFQSPTPVDSAALRAALQEAFGNELVDLSVQTVSGPGGYGATVQFAFNQRLKEAADALAKGDAALQAGDEEGARAAYQSAMAAVSAYASAGPPPQDTQAMAETARKTLEKAREAFEVRLKETIVQRFGLPADLPFQRQEIGAVIGELFWQNALTVAVIAMLLISLVIFVLYRELIPSLAIIAAIFFDVGFALAMMAVFSIPLTLATIPALLMLIGYSVDTDIILTTRLFKRKGADLFQNAASCLRTGLTMTLTSIVAVLLMVVLARFAQMDVVADIASVLLFGLVGDLVATWFMNAPVLMWYVEKKKAAVAG